MLSWICDKKLHLRLLAHSQSPSKECPWDKETTDQAANTIQRTLKFPDTVLEVEAGQPFRLDLLKGVAERIHDVYASLPDILRKGVHTGYHTPIPPSGIWKNGHQRESLFGA